jgi:hypothetical protein
MKARGIHGAGRCVAGLPRFRRLQARPPPSLPSLPRGRKKDVVGQTFCSSHSTRACCCAAQRRVLAA